MVNIIKQKGTRLFIILAGFFVTNAIVAEFIGVKIFQFEESIGLDTFNWHLFGVDGTLQLTAGVLLWPIVFIMTDVINEYYGQKGVKLLSYLTAGLIAYGFIMVFVAIHLTPADWWVSSYEAQGINNMQNAFQQIFGQGNWIIIGSLIAFLIGQILDAYVFYRVRVITGEGKIWLRATVSTAVSQFIDSFVVLYVAFVLGPPQWELPLFFAVGSVNYVYKLTVAILLIPLLYVAHHLIDKYLGQDLSLKMRNIAAGKE